MITILFTGGTISMKLDPATGAAVPALSGAEILAHVPELSKVAEIEFEEVSRLPGPHVTPERMWNLARRAAAWLDRPDVDGLVITHGTDTLEETAYLLDLLLLSPKPVVMVGAIRTASEPGWDGPANLLAAVRVAADPKSRRARRARRDERADPHRQRSAEGPHRVVGIVRVAGVRAGRRDRRGPRPLRPHGAASWRVARSRGRYRLARRAAGITRRSDQGDVGRRRPLPALQRGESR